MFKEYIIWFESTVFDYYNQFKSHANPEQFYKQLAMQLHPDRGGDHKEFVAMQNGYDRFKKQHNEPQSYSQSRNREVPPWQTDSRSSYNVVGRDFTNLNFCKKEIYDKAVENGEPLERYTIFAFDGRYFRGTFTVFANTPTLGFAGMAMEYWNSHGANPYRTPAVFAQKEGTNILILIRSKGRDVSNEDIVFQHDSFNSNPGNDQEFMSKLRGRFK